MNSRLKDPDLAMLFENTFPSTLDTTVKYFDQDENLAFIITGVSLSYQTTRCTYANLSRISSQLYNDSIRPAPHARSAQWLRDTGNQFAHLHKLLPFDSELQALVKAVINTEARYIAAFPYCGESTFLQRYCTKLRGRCLSTTEGEWSQDNPECALCMEM
jgi:hypothetical protein